MPNYRVEFQRISNCEAIVEAKDEADLIEKVKTTRLRGETHKTVLTEPRLWKISELPTPNITALQISKAFAQHKSVLLATKSSGCCPGQEERLSVANEGVLLRKLLESLGFTEDEIENAYFA